ncbi:MAG: acyl-CoA dehydrogenase family protein, partial [Myxococcota bacterium]|nr:acyl-CoA dehydrogenase family protein [Myxococcota bacterium]
MDFGLSEDQIMLDETLRSFLADQVSIERVRALREDSCPNHREIWKALAELGATGVLVPESHGGSELTLLDAAIVSQTLGHAVTPSPFLGSAILSTVALRGLSHEAIPGWLGGIASGDTIFGVATTELFSRREEAGIRLEGGTLTGKAMMALDSCNADFILIGVDAETLAVIKRDSQGVEVNRLLTTDATRCTSEIILEGVSP